MNIVYQCCFCKEAIANDICGIELHFKWNRSEDDQSSQLFFAHAECFSAITEENLNVEVDFDKKPLFKIGGKEVTEEEWQASVRQRLGKKHN